MDDEVEEELNDGTLPCKTNCAPKFRENERVSVVTVGIIPNKVKRLPWQCQNCLLVQAFCKQSRCDSESIRNRIFERRMHSVSTCWSV